MIDQEIIKKADLEKISNPKLKHILEERDIAFQFFYSEGTRHSDGSHTEYRDHKDYTVYKERYKEYNEENYMCGPGTEGKIHESVTK